MQKVQCYFDFCFSHCSGVRVFCSNAWMSFSSSAKQVFTILKMSHTLWSCYVISKALSFWNVISVSTAYLCLCKRGLPSNWEETTSTLKLVAHLLADVSSTSYTTQMTQHTNIDCRCSKVNERKTPTTYSAASSVISLSRMWSDVKAMPATAENRGWLKCFHQGYLVHKCDNRRRVS